ncbi:MAG TPA: A/G-specific adenine glycosylase [Chloroflexota bacterium]|nr:A/G-specific adenine glycosylase [Chloroflexota bacterium]
MINRFYEDADSSAPSTDDGQRWLDEWTESVQRRLLDWYQVHRRDLPWRDALDPYRVVVAEVMLQQTGVERVRPKFEEFVRQFPSFTALADAPTADVIRAWSGLGYNRRAVNLQRLARVVVDQHDGALPASVGELRRLPGIGPYTAGAIASFVHGHDAAAIDVNVRRVVGRLAFGTTDLPVRTIDRLAEQLVPAGKSRDWNQALMDFGSSQCTLTRPACLICPLRDACSYTRISQVDRTRAPSSTLRRVAETREPFVGSSRFYRGRVVECLRQLPAGDWLAITDLGPRVKDDWNPSDQEWLAGIVAGLARDGLVVIDDSSVSLPGG